MDDETLFHHKSTGLEHDDETPASPRGSFHGDFTLEDGELTVASQDQSALQETHLSYWTISRQIPPHSKQAESHPSQQVRKAFKHQP